MAKPSSKTLSMVVSAIKNLRESKGSSCRDILNYISSVCDVSPDIAKRQMVAALKRGVAHGIIRYSDGYYSLPTDTEAECVEVAAQELGLLDLCCRKKKREQRKRKSAAGCKKSSKRRKKSRKSRRSKGSRGCKKRGSRSKKRRSSKMGKRGGGCGCKSKSKKRSSKRGGKSGCKLTKKRPKKPKTEGPENTKCNTDYLDGESFDKNEFLARRCRTRSKSRSCSRNRDLVSTA